MIRKRWTEKSQNKNDRENARLLAEAMAQGVNLDEGFCDTCGTFYSLTSQSQVDKHAH